MQTLMLVLFVAVFAGAAGFVAGRVWEIRSGMPSRGWQPIDLVFQKPAGPERLIARSEPPMGV